MIDRGESPTIMEPMLIGASSRYRPELTDLTFDLVEKSAGFRKGLPESITTALADLVRSMNCYYSNLIEGHDTHPVDIERALQGEYSANPAQRNLQLEAKAHISVQTWIDNGGLIGKEMTAEGMQAIHRKFCELLPDELLTVEEPKTTRHIRVVPGEYRQRDVQVGTHIPVSPGSLPRFIQRYEDVYQHLGKSEGLLAAAAAHHRFLWIHPFIDGNGRVARLMSYAQLLSVLDTGGIWSIARGLARQENDYKRHLVACDQERQNDLDGRGNLSERALVDFTRFFLQTCVDQVTFMETLVQPDRLKDRILRWAEEEKQAGTLQSKAGLILEAILYRDTLPRGDVADIVGTTDRQARRIVSDLVKHGVVTSKSSRAPLRLAFPAKLAHRWTPGLFPEQ
jgi:Fic family protein